MATISTVGQEIFAAIIFSWMLTKPRKNHVPEYDFNDLFTNRVYTKLLEVLPEGYFQEPSARAERGILEAFARAEWLLHSEYSKLGEC